MVEDLPAEIADTVDALDAELEGEKSIDTGPMPGESPDTTVAQDVPIGEIRVYEDFDPALGDVFVVEVELDMDVGEYRFHNDPDNPDQYSPAEYVHQAFESVGIGVPRDTNAYGVQLGYPDDPDNPMATYVSRPVVQGYIRASDALEADGGVILPAFDVIHFGAVPLVVGMARLLNDLGEEYTIKTDLDAVSLDVGVYDDASAGATGDAVSDTDDIPLTTEPTDGNYVRQTVAMSADDLSGNWGVDTDTDAVFDMTNTTGPVDSWMAVANFQAVDTADGAVTDHLVCTGALSQEYDLSNLTQLTITAGGVGWTVT